MRAGSVSGQDREPAVEGEALDRAKAYADAEASGFFTPVDRTGADSPGSARARRACERMVMDGVRGGGWGGWGGGGGTANDEWRKSASRHSATARSLNPCEGDIIRTAKKALS